MFDDIDENGRKLTPAEKKRRHERQEKWRRAADLRARFTPEQIADEEHRLAREVQTILDARRAA